jgi:general secretion pathway protein D
MAAATGLHAVGGQAGAQQPPAEAAQIRLSGDLELVRLVDLAAARRAVRVIYEPQALSGRVSIRGVETVSDEELWRLASHALASRGFAFVETLDPGTLTVVRPAEGGLLGPVRAEGGPPGIGLSTVLLRPKHRSARELVEVAKPLVTRGVGSASAWADSNVVLLTDLAERLVEVRRLLELADVPAVTPQVLEVPVTQVSPGSMVELLGQVVGAMGGAGGAAGPGAAPTGVSGLHGRAVPSPTGDSVLVIAPADQGEAWRALIARLDRREQAVTRTYTTAAFEPREVAELIENLAGPGRTGGDGEDDRWRVVADELTGSLVVTATPERHARVAEVFARFAAMEGPGVRPMRVFPVRNRPVADLLASLNELLDAGVLTDGARDEQSEAGLQRTSGATSPARREGDAVASAASDGAQGPTPRAGRAGVANQTPVTLTADESTNTLIAVGEPRLLSQLAGLIRTLDVRQPQVMLEVMLVSMSESQSRSLGVELERLDVFGNTLTRLSSIFGLSSGGPGERTFGDSTGFTGVVLNPGDYSVLVRALKTVTEGRTMSLPRVLVNNNERAQFSSTLQQPVASINVGNNVSTTSFGGTQDAGTTVSIRPQIAEGDHLVLEYSLAISSFVGSAPSAGLPPPRQQNRIDSVATIPDGHTVVVGGLELTSDGRSVDRVPVASAVPVLGELFKNRSRSGGVTRFYVFIRPIVLRHETFEDLRHITARSIGTIDAAGGPPVSDGFPELAPRVIR